MTRPNHGKLALGSIGAIAVAALAIPAIADAAPRPRGPGLYLKQVENPKYVVRPDDVTVKYELLLVGKTWANDVFVKTTFTPSGGRRPSRTVTDELGLFNPSPPNPLSKEVEVDLQLGRYEVEACARFKYDGHKVVRCKRGKDLSVVPRSWSGSTDVTAPLFNQPDTQAVQGATSTNARFQFEGLSGQEFSYSASGDVRFYVNGTDPHGCMWSGSRTVAASTGDKLMLSKALLAYRFVPQTSFLSFPITADCPPPLQDSTITTFSGPWLPAFPQTRARSTESTLSGSTPVAFGVPGGFSWSLLAGDG